MLKTLKNAWRIPELRSKLLFTLLIIVLYRLGANIPVPYVDPHVFEEANAVAGGTFLYFINLMSGGALGRATLFALGVSPYITSSIVMQLLTIALPPLERLAKQGEEGKKKITAITRLVTVGLALITGVGYAAFVINQNMSVLSGEVNAVSGNVFGAIFKSGHGFEFIVMVACYCAGAALVMWLAEKINESGIGNGISIILFANIIASLPGTVDTIWRTIFTEGGFSGFKASGLAIGLSEIIILLGLVVIIVWMSDAERRIPIQYAKRVVGRKMYGGQNTNLPLKVNMAGVMPIIFASSIVSIPSMIAGFMSPNGFTGWVEKWFSYTTIPYLVVYVILMFAFAYFYVAISFNPVEVANNIKNNGGAIPGIRSGRPTIVYLKKILSRITLLGALIIVFIAAFPMLITDIDVMVTNANHFAALSFGGSSLIIVVGVALETVRELEAQMSLRNYKGFLD